MNPLAVIDDLAAMDRVTSLAEMHRRLDQIEDMIRASGERHLEPIHHFSPGVYARELRIPKGTILTGKIHRTRHVNVVTRGAIVVYSPIEGMRKIRAPFAFVAEAGTRRLGIAIEDTIWTTYHLTHETDLAKIEAEVIIPRAELTFDEPAKLSGGNQ